MFYAVEYGHISVAISTLRAVINFLAQSEFLGKRAVNAMGQATLQRLFLASS